MSLFEHLESRLLLASGVLDPTFNGGGTVTTAFAATAGTAYAVAVQPNGQIVAAGSSGSLFTLARYNTDGSLDSTFGSNGVRVSKGIPFSAQINAVAVQSDGQIVAAGFQGAGQFVVARYNTNGTIDTSFGTGGTVVPNFPTTFGQATALAIQPDGKIVVAGKILGQKSGTDDFVVVRLTTTGALDPTFHGKGFVVTDFAGGNDVARGLLIQPDGAIVVVGTAQVDGRDDFGVARYTANGTLDGTFGSGGLVTSPFGTVARAKGVGIQSNDDLIVTGTSTTAAGIVKFTTARYTPTGALDSSFGTNGIVKTAFPAGSAVARSLLVGSDDSLVAVGSAGTGGFALAGYTSTGALDSTFGPGGTVLTPIGTSSTAYAATLDPTTGDIVVAGQSLLPRSVLSGFAVARYSGFTASTAAIPATQLTMSATPGNDLVAIGSGGTGGAAILGGTGNDTLLGGASSASA